jgi:negative regulator of flagellin synthesis FlgM
MRVELNGLTAVQGAADRSAKQVSAGSAASTNSVTTDRATLQSSSASVQSLVSQAMSTPDVRQDKVAALQQSISNGTYKVDVDKLASALVTNLSR